MATLKASINGFSISNLKTMMGEDGYVIRCTLLREGKKLGEFYDKGDGSEYYFYPTAGHTQDEVETILHGFPVIEFKEEGFHAIHWNIGILVEKLIQKKEQQRLYNAAKKRGKSLILVHDREHHLDYTLTCSEKMADASLESGLKATLAKKGITDFEWKRYQGFGDFNEILK